MACRPGELEHLVASGVLVAESTDCGDGTAYVPANGGPMTVADMQALVPEHPNEFSDSEPQYEVARADMHIDSGWRTTGRAFGLGDQRRR